MRTHRPGMRWPSSRRPFSCVGRGATQSPHDRGSSPPVTVQRLFTFPDALLLRHSPGDMYPEENPMTRDRLGSLVGVCAGSVAIALSLPPTAAADPPPWNGTYAITFIVGPKAGTSIAAGQPEVQYTDTYTFRSS